MPMYEGNWTCSGCGGSITSLPFEPRNTTGLTCRTCYAKRKDKTATSTPITQTASEVPDIPVDAGLATEPPPLEDAFAGLEGLEENAPQTKKKHEGAWSCSMCGNAITSLPFEPRSTHNLKCLECYRSGA